jgi:Flp pilus assembly pilin Flp
MPPDPQSPLTAADDALPAIDAISTWINNADTKIGLLGIVDTALTGAFAAQHDRARTLIDHADLRGIIALALLAFGVAALVTSILTLFRALQPRLDSHHPSRFAFPWIADAQLADLIAGDHETIRREAWIQAQTLSRIVRAKYESLRRALPCAILAGALLVSWLIAAPSA